MPLAPAARSIRVFDANVGNIFHNSHRLLAPARHFFPLVVSARVRARDAGGGIVVDRRIMGIILTVNVLFCF